MLLIETHMREEERETYIHGGYLAKLTGLLQRQKKCLLSVLQSDCCPLEDLPWK